MLLIASVGAGLVGVWLIVKYDFLSDLTEKLDTTQSQKAIEESKDIDSTKKKVQKWLSKEPRNTEIKSDMANTYQDHIPVESSDGETFIFYTIIGNISEGTQLQVVVETKTGWIVTARPVDYKKQQKKDLFGYSEFVSEMRKQNKNYSSDQMRQSLQQAAVGNLMGRGQSGLDPLSMQQMAGTGETPDSEDLDEEGDEDGE